MANLDSSNKKWASMSNDQKKSVQDALSRVRGNGGGNETPQQALQRIASQGYYTPKSAFEINTNPFTEERNENAGTAFNDYLKQRQAALDRARQQSVTDFVRNVNKGQQAYNDVRNILQQNQERKRQEAEQQARNDAVNRLLQSGAFETRKEADDYVDNSQRMYKLGGTRRHKEYNEYNLSDSYYRAKYLADKQDWTPKEEAEVREIYDAINGDKYNMVKNTTPGGERLAGLVADDPSWRNVYQTMDARLHPIRESTAYGFAHGTGANSIAGVIGGQTDEYNKRVAPIAAQHPIATRVGALAGSQVLMYTLGPIAAVATGAAQSAGLVGGVNTIGGIGKVASSIAGARALNTAFLFGATDAIYNADKLAKGKISGGQYVKGVTTSAAGGALGSIAAGLVYSGIGEVLRKSHNMNSEFGKWLAVTMGSAARSGTDLAVNQGVAYATDDDEMKMTPQQIAMRLATTFLYSQIDYAMNSASMNMQAKQKLQRDIIDLYEGYDNLAQRNYGSEEEFLSAYNKLKTGTQRFRNELNSQYLPGQQEYVDSANEKIDALEQILDAAKARFDAGDPYFDMGKMLTENIGGVPSAGASPSGPSDPAVDDMLNNLMSSMSGNAFNQDTSQGWTPDMMRDVMQAAPTITPSFPTVTPVSDTMPSVQPSIAELNDQVNSPFAIYDASNDNGTYLDPEVATLAESGAFNSMPTPEGFEALPEEETNNVLMNLAQQRESIKEQQRQALYDAGKNQEQNIQPLMESATMLSQEEKLAAIRQGNADAAQAEIEMIRQENLPLESAKENLNVRAEETGTVVQREGSERNLAVSTGESTAAVSRGAGETEEDWRNWSAAADKGIESVYGRMAKATQAESLIRTAEPGQVIHYIPEDATPAVSKGVAMARSYGVDVKPFVSGSDIMVEGGESVRAFADPLTRSIGFKANDEAALGDQLVRHELIEFGIMDNKVNVTDAINHLKSDIPEEFLSAIASVYIPKSALNDLDFIDDPRLKKEKMQELYYRANKEMLCDVGAGINQLKGIAGYENLSDVVDEIISTLQPYMNERLGGVFDAKAKPRYSNKTGGTNRQDNQIVRTDAVEHSSKLNVKPKEDLQNIEKSGINVSYSLSENGDRITISPESYMNDATWKKVHNAFNRLGYGMPSVDITKKYVLEGYPLQADQTKAVKKILGLSLDDDTKGIDIEKAKKLASKAARHYGTTTSFNKAAYITVNGSMLDFSEGQGYRTMDHRQISEILDLPDDAGYSDGMIEFMNQGNIRMQTYGIDISVEPNAAQRRVLTNFIHSLDGEFTLDISNENGYNVASVEYPEGTRPARIFADIDRYFKEGIIPQDDSIANYHMAYSSKLNLDGTTAPTFYSKLQREINNFKGDKIGAASVESYLKGKGVKDEEIKWSGIRLFLDGKKSVGKQELLDYLKANELQLETKVLSSDTGETMYEDGEGTTITRSRLEELAAYWTDDLGYASYKIVPHGESADDIVYYDADGNEVDREKYWHAESKGDTHWSDYKLDGGENYREILFKIPNSEYSNRAMQTHWGESGVLAHARLQDFNSDNGKRILFVEEIQSDWHNAGHQYGYGKDNIKEKRHTYLNERTNAVRTALLKAFEKDDVDAFLSNDREKVASIPQEQYFAMLSVEDKAQMKWNANNTEKFETISKAALDGEYAPDAPFKQNYTDFVLKDLLRVAAEDDYDYLAWTTADMQSRRWSGEYAEGYRIEYDQEIPGFLKKYGKQWKAGLTSITIDNDNSDTVPAITVNDEMKQSVLYEGQPMFSTKLGLDEAILNDTFPDWEEAFNAPKDDVMDVSESRQQFMQSYADSNDTVKALNVALGRSLDNKLTVNADASKVANSIVKKYRSGTDADKVSSDIEKLYESLGDAAKDSVNKIATAAADIGAEILDGIKTTDKTMQDSYPNLKKELKSYKLTISDQDKKDVGSAYDGFNNFRKKMFGKLTLVKQDTKGAVPVDTAYQELSEKYPDLFPDDIIALPEQMVRMAEVANSLKATKVNAVEGMDEYDYEMQAYVIGQEILKDYYTAAGETGYGKVFDEELAKVRQKYEKQIQRLKASNNAKVDRVKQKYEDRIAKANARRKLTKTGNDLLKEFRKLKKMKGGPGFEAAKQALIGDFDLYSKGMRDDTKLKLEKLRDEAEALKEKDVNYANSNYDKDFKTFSRLNQKHIKNLSLDEMEDLIEAAVELRHAQEIQNKVLKDNKRISAATIARRGIEQQRKAKSLNKNNELGSLTYRMFRGIEGYNFQSLSAVRALRAMDGYRENGVLSGIGKDLNDGYIRSVDFEMKARKSFEEFTNDKKFMDSLSKPTVEITNPANGKTAMITPGMRMAVYLMSKDPDNRNHIKSGGLCIPNVKLYTQRAGKEAYADDVRFRLEYTDLQDIYSGMTDREKAFADRMFQFYNGGKDVLITTKDAMNETSMLLNGHEIAFSDNHYPISTNKNFIQGGAKDKYQNPTIEGGGFLKERKVNASNPIYLEDATDVLNRSINNVKNYYGLAVPIRNANAILNFTESGFDTSLRQEIDKAWKGFGLKIIDNIIDDLNAGGRRQGIEPGKLDKFQSRYVTSVFAANAGVMMKQFSSYPMALAYLHPDSMLKGLNLANRVDLDYIDSITPLHWARRKGMSGTELGEVYDYRQGVTGKLEKGANRLTNGITHVDVFTTKRLASAAIAEMKKYHPEFKEGTPEYDAKLAELINNVFQLTQPSYDVLHRSEYQRSTGDFARIMSMFSTASLNMSGEVADAFGEFRAKMDQAKTGEGTKADAKRAASRWAKVLNAYILAQVSYTAIGALWNLALHKGKNYRDEKGEITAESFIKRVGTDAIENIIGGGFFGGKQVVGIATLNWDDMVLPGLSTFNSTMNDITDFIEQFGNVLTGKETDTSKLKKVSFHLARDLGAVGLGLPINTFYNFANAGKLWIDDIKNGKLGTWDAGEGLFGLSDTSVNKKEYAQQALSAIEDGNQEKTDYALQNTGKDQLEEALGAESQKKEDGKTIKDSKRMDALKKIDEMNINDTDKAKLASRMYDFEGVNGDNWKEYINTLEAKMNGKQEGVIEYLSTADISEEERRNLWENACGYSPKTYEKNFGGGETEAETEAETEPETEAEIPVETKPETETETVPETEPETEAVKPSGSGAEIESEITEGSIEGDARYAYIVDAVQNKKHSAEEAVAWYNSDPKRVNAGKYIAWTNAGGSTYDYIKTRSDLSKFKGNGKQEKIANYILNQGYSEEKQRVIWFDICDYSEKNWNKYFNSNRSWQDAGAYLNQRKRQVWYGKPGEVEVKKGDPLGKLEGLRSHIKEQASTVAAMAAMAAPDRETRANIIAKHFEKNVTGFNLQDIFDMQEHNFPSKVVYAAFKKLPARTQYAYIMENWPRWAVKEYEEGYESDARDFTRPNANELREFIDKRWKLFEAY